MTPLFQKQLISKGCHQISEWTVLGARKCNVVGIIFFVVCMSFIESISIVELLFSSTVSQVHSEIQG